MRQIKFRVIQDGKIIGYERLTDTGWKWMCPELNPDSGERWVIGVLAGNSPLDRNEFTGLLDKNKVEIYEGDIIRVPVDIPYVSTHGEYSLKEIIYRNGAWVASYISSKAKLPRGYIAGELTNSRESENDEYCLYDDESYCIINCEIIGNIYENPDLITES